MADLSICIRNVLTGEELCSLSVDSSITVLALKEEISDLVDVHAAEQCLLLAGKSMRDGAILGEDFKLLQEVDNHVDVHLARIEKTKNPDFRKKNFQQIYMDHFSYGQARNRWEYHHSEHASCETDLDRGWGNRGKLYVTLRRDEQRSATFSLCSLDFPFSELFDTFAEQLGAPLLELQFAFQGRVLGREDTPHLCGMEPCDMTNAYVIEVTPAGGQRHRQRMFAILNSMSNAVHQLPRSMIACEAVLSADTWLKAFMWLPLEDLLSTTLVSSFWFHATQRLSLMLQLRHSEIIFSKAPPQQYKIWLTSIFGHSQQLALAEAQMRHKELEAWHGLNMTKELSNQKPYTFTKAAGCTSMKTVSLSGLSADFEQQWLSLHSCKSKFMAECKSWCEAQGHEANIGQDEYAAAQTQELCSSCNVAEIVRPQFRAVAIELFRRYFSPDMYFIFPLIVGQEAAFGLDFRSTTTTMFFAPISPPGKARSKLSTQLKHFTDNNVPAPVGACSWRFRWPLLADAEIQGFSSIERPCALLEILFIAVWEEEREQVRGGKLVEDLEARARTAGVKIMYVEIGFEQPKARRFWRKQGFKKVVRLDASEAEKRQWEEAAESEEVPVPLIYLSNAQLDFFESNCLRFSDTAQYVKVLE